jgi:hypothetical protein
MTTTATTWLDRLAIGARNPLATISALIYRGNNISSVEKIARLNGIPPGQGGTNSLAHALTSAWTTLQYGSEPAREVGIGKELETYIKDVAAGNQWDIYKDLWNNNVGRQIGEFGCAQNLNADQVTDLVLDAFFSGKIIVSRTDVRID